MMRFCYISDESGEKELYVIPFPGSSGRRQISSGGAVNGYWLGEGKEIVYVTPDYKLMAVEILVNGSILRTGNSRFLFGGRPIPFTRTDDSSRGGGIPLTRDGKRLLFPVPLQTNVPQTITVVTNWQHQLNEK